MKKITTVTFAIGVKTFASEKEVTPQLVMDYIKQEATGVYANIRLVPRTKGEVPSVIVYDTEPFDDECNFTETIEYLLTSINLY